MSQELACLQEIRGRCLTIHVCYPDTAPRMQSATEALDRSIGLAVKGPLTPPQLSELDEELQDLRTYLNFVVSECPETSVEVKPTLEAIGFLLDPVQ